MQALRVQPILVTAALLLAGACGGTEDASTPDDRTPGGKATEQQGDNNDATTADQTSSDSNKQHCTGAACVTDAQLKAAHLAGSTVALEARQSAEIGAAAVNEATAQAGSYSIVTTGTLTEQGAGVFGYGPEPSDRLVVHFAKGDELTYYIKEAQGTPNADHRYDYRVVVAGKADMHFISQRLNGQIQQSAQGKMTLTDVEYAVDLTVQGTYTFESDTTGSEMRDDYHVGGTVTADGFALQVDESWHFELVSSTGMGAAVATADRRTINSVLRVGGQEVRWNDVLIQKQFRDGKPTEADSYWKAQGTISAGGNVIAEYKLDNQLVPGKQNGGFMLVELALADGSAIELQRWDGTVSNPY